LVGGFVHIHKVSLVPKYQLRKVDVRRGLLHFANDAELNLTLSEYKECLKF